MSHFHFLNKTQPQQVLDLDLPPNHSCVLLKKRTISVEPTPLPILQPDGVLVKVVATDELATMLMARRKADEHVFAEAICTITSREAWVAGQ